MRTFEKDRPAINALVEEIRAREIADPAVLAAMAEVPRRLFVSAQDSAVAYLDRTLPIECGQTIGPPSVAALMISALTPKADSKVLEVGCGSGYTAAILSRLVTRVVTLDRFRTLIELAEDRFTTMKVDTVTALVADGFEGFTRHAPYDRILVDGAVAKAPTALMDQLADGGVLVAPLGLGPAQTLVRIVRDGRLFHRTEIGRTRVGPLIEGVAKKL